MAFDKMLNHPLYLREGRENAAAKYRINLDGIDLINQNLTGINLSDAFMYGAQLNGASLKDANLSGVVLCEASLSGTDMTGANLDDAVLSAADASSAIGLLTYHGDKKSLRASQNIQVDHETKFPYDVLQLFMNCTPVTKTSDRKGRLCVSPEGCDTGFIVYEYSGEFDNESGMPKLADLAPFFNSINNQCAGFDSVKLVQEL